MRPAEKIESLIKKLQYKASAETHGKVLNNVLQALDKNEKQKSGAQAPYIWSTIMKNPITKLAAAAIIIIAAIVVISQLGIHVENSAFAQVADRLRTAQTLAYKVITNSGIEMDMVFKEPGYMRTTTADGYTNIIDWSQNRGISIWPLKKQYIDFEASNLPHDPDKNNFAIIEELRSLPYQADEVLGEKEIDGRVVQGFRVFKADTINTVWIDPVTEQLVRVEMEYTNAPGMNTIMTDFQFNVELDDSLFSLTPPADFTCMEVQADVSTVTEQDLIDYLQMWSTWTKDSTFPPTFNPLELPKITADMIKQGQFGEGDASQQDHSVEAAKMYRGIMFVTQLPADSNWRYAGENVQFGDAAAPIFWYRPVGSVTYRIIYGDLHVEEATPENLPD
jgi:outer membrane lipoprotein-sorting protein